MPDKKRAIVIGNSPSVLNYEIGKFIDEFDVVLRCNWYQISGYEKYVGTKTNIWFFRFTNMFVDAFERPNKFHKLDSSVYGVDEYWIRTANRGGTVSEKRTNEFKQNIIKGNSKKNKGYGIFSKHFDTNRITKVIPTDTMCVGLQLVKTAAEVFDEVWSFGNTFHTEKLPLGKKGRYHYYDLDSGTSLLDKKKLRKHKYNTELDILRKLNVKIVEYDYTTL